MISDMDMEEGEPVTLQEAWEEIEEQEKKSVAVLGASDPDNCSYPKVTTSNINIMYV